MNTSNEYEGELELEPTAMFLTHAEAAEAD